MLKKELLKSKGGIYLPLTGGTLSGDLVMDDNTAIHTSALYVGDKSITELIREIASVKTVNGIEPDENGNISIPLNYLPLAGGTMTGRITMNNRESSWYNGRNSAFIRIENGTLYNVLASLQCGGYSWEIGCEGSNNGNGLRIGCVSDTNFNNAANAQNQYFRFTLDGDFIASRDLRATSWVYGNTFKVNSDKRLKKNIKDVSISLPEVELKSFSFKNNPDKKCYGFIAQDVLKKEPKLVNKQENGYYSIDTTALLCAAVVEINKLKARIAALENSEPEEPETPTPTE